jgi:hypothetical protein
MTTMRRRGAQQGTCVHGFGDVSGRRGSVERRATRDSVYPSNVDTVASINLSGSDSPARTSSTIRMATSSATGMVLRPVSSNRAQACLNALCIASRRSSSLNFGSSLHGSPLVLCSAGQSLGSPTTGESDCTPLCLARCSAVYRGLRDRWRWTSLMTYDLPSVIRLILIG